MFSNFEKKENIKFILSSKIVSGFTLKVRNLIGKNSIDKIFFYNDRN